MVELGGVVIVDTAECCGCWRPAIRRRGTCPVQTSPPALSSPVSRTSFCEWKGHAHYWDVLGGEAPAGRRVVLPGADARIRGLVDYVSLYPGRMERCTIDGEAVRAQDGGFYGGWVTDDVVGPFKGGPGGRLVTGQ